jgi:hypothetical protein
VLLMKGLETETATGRVPDMRMTKEDLSAKLELGVSRRTAARSSGDEGELLVYTVSTSDNTRCQLWLKASASTIILLVP